MWGSVGMCEGTNKGAGTAILRSRVITQKGMWKTKSLTGLLIRKLEPLMTNDDMPFQKKEESVCSLDEATWPRGRS